MLSMRHRLLVLHALFVILCPKVLCFEKDLNIHYSFIVTEKL